MLKGIGEGATYFYHPDHLGSVSVVSNHKGVPYERVEYLPFGEVWVEDVDPATRYIPFRFTSKELDRETGLYYYGARYYEPKVSRWMSADPAGFALVNPMGSDGKPKSSYSVIEATNWYSYTSNNPVKYVDPTGMETTYFLIIYNIDPTPGSDEVAAIGTDDNGNPTLKVGHTWMSVEKNVNGEVETSYLGWSAAGNPASGETVPGMLLETQGDNLDGRKITEEFSMQITEEQYDRIIEYWNGLEQNGTLYNFAGREAKPGNALNCTEAVKEALIYSGVLNPAQEENLTGPFGEWKIPANVPSDFEDLAESSSTRTAPSPDEFGRRMNRHNNPLLW